MMFAPAAIAEHKMTAEDLRRDSRNCVRTGPCGIGEKAVYLNSFFVDRRYYVMWQDIGRVFKRVAMSRGGFTGKGVFGSIPYLVVLLKDGTERQCNFKYEDEVDLFLSLVRSRHPEIPTMSEKAQARMEEERAREEARYVKDLTPQAQASMEELRRARAYLDREPEIPAFLSVTAKEKRITDRMNPWYRYAALAIFLLAVGSVLFGIYAVIRQEGYAVYFVLFGMAFIFYTMSAQVLPTGRNNRRYADGRWQKALRQSGEYISRYGDTGAAPSVVSGSPAAPVSGTGGRPDSAAAGAVSAFPLPAQYAHPATIDRMIRVIREGRAQTVEEAYEVMKKDLQAINSDVTVPQIEYDEIVAIKPMFLLCGYREEPVFAE
ncbi:MAG: ATPase P [Lachnospiraceae bacterium]|nr:ATPase P [Lachnospiraceae bacterium]